MLTNEMHSYLRRKNRNDIILEIKYLIDENRKLRGESLPSTANHLIEDKWLRSCAEDSIEKLLRKWGF